MAEKENTANLKWDDYDKPGLYLVFDDLTRLELTRENTENITKKYWSDPKRIPQSVKEAAEFQRCHFCPLKGKDDFCDALRPVQPLLDVIDNYNSFDNVMALYKGDEEDLYHVSNTTLQRALRYMSSLSLMTYCRIGRQYRKYYTGIIPIMKTDEVVNRLYLNIYWIHGGDETAVQGVITKMKKDITITTQNQLKRLRLICQNDAFLNAFVLTHLVTDLLDEFKDRKLKEALRQLDPLHESS